MTEIQGLDNLMREVNATRHILDNPEQARAVLRALLEGKRVKGSDAAAVVAVLLRCAQDYQWCAKRYADGRSTYAVGMVNDATHLLLTLGAEIRPTDGSVWARDGMFGYPKYAEAGPLHALASAPEERP